jgi:ribosomal protein S18 acetylase RimI-like enzyme
MGRLARARERRFEGEEETTDEEIAHDLDVPDMDLAEDTRIAEDSQGEVIGYADLLPGGGGLLNATIWTPPEATELTRAAERGLLDFLETRAVEIGASQGLRQIGLHIFVSRAEEERGRLLADRGFSLRSTFHRMLLPGETPVSDAPAPEGVEMAPLDPARDAAAVHALLRRAFGEHELLGIPAEEAAWRHETVEDPRWVPGPSLVARADGELVGAVVGFPEEDQGWIRNLGVARSQRGRGLGAALLAASFRAFRDLGLAPVGLGVDSANRSGATALYERMGMRVAKQVDLLARMLDVG